MKCCICNEERKGDTLGGGWKQKGSQIFCPTHWHKLYHIRSVTFPVASIVDGPGESSAERWKAFREALNLCWQQSTQLANWSITEMAKRDTVRTPDLKKLPSPPANKKGVNPSFYLYPDARALFPDLDTQSTVAILNTVQAKYKESRFDVIWRRESVLPTFKFPYPYPVPASAWKYRWLSESEKTPVVEVSLNRQKFHIRLRGGKGFDRQKKSFAALVAGEALPCEMALYRVRAASNDNRIGMRARTDGASVSYNVMCKLVLWLPKEIVVRKEKVLTVKTDKDSFIIASFGDSELWRVNADHVKRWVAEYDTRRHRLSDDLKAELRAGGADRFADLRARLAKHQRDRIGTFMHQTTRQVSNYAARHHCSAVMVNDECREYLPAFPWDQFKTQLATKLNETNIEFSEWSDRPDKDRSDGGDSSAGSEDSTASKKGTKA